MQSLQVLPYKQYQFIMQMVSHVTKIQTFPVNSVLILDGFFPDPSSPKNAVCVAKCPESKQTTVNCLTDSVNCPSGSITSTYGTFQILTYCILDPSITGQSFSQTFNVKVVVQWIFDV
jgi:hypothetical protein